MASSRVAARSQASAPGAWGDADRSKDPLKAPRTNNGSSFMDSGKISCPGGDRAAQATLYSYKASTQVVCSTSRAFFSASPEICILPGSANSSWTYRALVRPDATSAERTNELKAVSTHTV